MRAPCRAAARVPDCPRRSDSQARGLLPRAVRAWCRSQRYPLSEAMRPCRSAIRVRIGLVSIMVRSMDDSDSGGNVNDNRARDVFRASDSTSTCPGRPAAGRRPERSGTDARLGDDLVFVIDESLQVNLVQAQSLGCRGKRHYRQHALRIPRHGGTYVAGVIGRCRDGPTRSRRWLSLPEKQHPQHHRPSCSTCG